MAAVDKYLVRRDVKLSPLFTPPFDAAAHDPGYIKGYPPGVRENGGQYTHGAIWAVLAFAMQGDGDKAGELFVDPQSDQSCRQPGGSATLQGRALRGLRRPLFRAAACRARRMDLVHGFGRMDVPGGA